MKEVALYVHIPFCKQKCFYCDFSSFSNMNKYMNDYIDALIKEIDERVQGYKIRSLFIGGGTPSYLDTINLENLMNKIKTLDFINNCEKTIECNPGTVTKEKFQIIKEGGINRLSFGLQSTKNEILKKIGRIHTYEEFKENYFLAREYGFNNINIDMMFGLPNQNIDIYLEGLKEIIKLEPEHISAYSLIIEEETPFFKMFNENLLILPTEDEEREMYLKGTELLTENNYNQYEISNYSKKNMDCFHNKVYWKCEEYIGVGLSASSYINNIRMKNISNISEYINKMKNNQGIIAEEYVNNINDNIEEYMFMNLRMLEGVNENDFYKRFNVKLMDIYKEVINKHINNGLLIKENNRIYLSKKGIELSNYVMSDMILD